MPRKIDHIGIAVSSIEQALDFYRNALGLQLHDVEEIQEQKVRVAMLPLGETNIELLEPMASDSPIAGFIGKKGVGIHHVAIRVNNIDETLSHMKSRGVRLINEQAVIGAGGKRIAFIHPASTGGVLLELAETNEEPAVP